MPPSLPLDPDGAAVVAARPAALKGQAVRAVMWSAVESWGSKVSSMIVFIVLARLLDPRDFGLLAAAVVVVSLAQTIMVAGFSEALVQRPTVERAHVDAAFWTSMAIGALLSLIVVVLAEPIASIFDEPDLVAVLRVLALSFVIRGAASAPQAMLRRDLQFKAVAVRSVVALSAAGCFAVVAAIAGAGVWALVGQVLVEAAVGTIVILAAARYVPSVRFSRQHVRDLLGFSGASLGADLVNFVHRRSDDFIVGWRLGSATLGIYSVAYRFMRLLDDMVSKVLYNVSFPVMSRVQHDERAFGRAYVTACGLSALAIMPVFAGLSVCSPEVVDVFFGPDWNEAGAVMRLLCIAGTVQGIQLFSLSALKASGGIRTVLVYNTVGTVVIVTGFVIASSHGLVAVAATYAALSGLFSIVPPMLVSRRVRLPLRRLGAALAPPLVATLAMVVVVAIAREQTTAWSPFLRLGTHAVLGAAVYAAVLLSVSRNVPSQVRSLLSAAKSGTPAATGA